MIERGIKGRSETVVSQENVALAMGSGELMVFATPAMIALAEKAAWTSVKDALADGEGTVGSKMEMSHIAPTPIGKKVWCESELLEIDRKRLVFKVTAFDESGMIGEGMHERFIINNEKFLRKANEKC